MKRSIDVLKTFFETGDFPTQQQFYDWMESYHHLDDGLVITDNQLQANGSIIISFNDGSNLVIPAPVAALLAGSGINISSGKINLGGVVTEDTTVTSPSFKILFENDNSSVELTPNQLAFFADALIEIITNADFNLSADNVNIIAGSIVDIISDSVSIQSSSMVVTATDTLEVICNDIEIKATNELRVLPKNESTAQVGEVLTKIGTNNETEWRPIYIPPFIVTNQGPSQLQFLQSNIKNIEGDFLDTIHTVSVIGLIDNTNVGVTVLSKSMNLLKIAISANDTAQNYEVSLVSGVKTEVLTYVGVDQTLLIPSVPPLLTNEIGWENIVGPVVVSSGKILTNTDTSIWEKGASFGSIPSNKNGILKFEYSFVSTSSSPLSMVGLNTDPATNSSYLSIDYAIFNFGSDLRVYENGSWKANIGTVNFNELVEIKTENGVVTYWVNGVLKYTSLVPYVGNLHFDSSLGRNTAIENIQIQYDN